MVWIDRLATKQFLKLRDEFNIKTFIETGTFNGVNVKFYAQHFKEVLSCEVVGSAINNAMQRTKDHRKQYALVLHYQSHELL